VRLEGRQKRECRQNKGRMMIARPEDGRARRIAMSESSARANAASKVSAMSLVTGVAVGITAQQIWPDVKGAAFQLIDRVASRFTTNEAKVRETTLFARFAPLPRAPLMRLTLFARFAFAARLSHARLSLCVERSSRRRVLQRRPWRTRTRASRWKRS